MTRISLILACALTVLAGPVHAQSLEPEFPDADEGPRTTMIQHQPFSGEGPPGILAQEINYLADRYWDYLLKWRPERFYFAGLEPPTHDGLMDNRAVGWIDAQDDLDAILSRLTNYDPDDLVGRPEWVTYWLLRQELGAEHRTRICRHDVWNVNQMSGWQVTYPELAQRQPVGSAELRRQALRRWSKFPEFIDEEIINLKRGLVMRYSAPRSVVGRVIEQVDGLLALEVEESPFYSPAARDGDPEFARRFHELVAEGIYPALARYRAYLAGDYMDRARDDLSVRSIPKGRLCYAASLQSYTTLPRGAEDVFALGEETVAANRQRVIELGEEAYGLDEFDAILERAMNDPDDKFADRDELLAFARRKVEEAEQAMPQWVADMPEAEVEVVPFLAHEEGTGRSAHYNPGSDDHPAEYRIPTFEAEKQSKGNVEVTAFHETWPGHHLQVATAQEIEGLHKVTKLIWFSGPGEGWARYSETLAEEMGLYETTTGPITRRAWPARGMVVDPGIHIFDWDREKAARFMAESGRFTGQSAYAMVDRIAILPGQLTAYDSGGLEIMALREEAEAALGEDFDIRAFHAAVLQWGTIPLPALRSHVERWIAEQQAAD